MADDDTPDFHLVASTRLDDVGEVNHTLRALCGYLGGVHHATTDRAISTFVAVHTAAHLTTLWTVLLQQLRECVAVNAQLALLKHFAHICGRIAIRQRGAAFQVFAKELLGVIGSEAVVGDMAFSKACGSAFAALGVHAGSDFATALRGKLTLGLRQWSRADAKRAAASLLVGLVRWTRHCGSLTELLHVDGVPGGEEAWPPLQRALLADAAVAAAADLSVIAFRARQSEYPTGRVLTAWLGRWLREVLESGSAAATPPEGTTVLPPTVVSTVAGAFVKVAAAFDPHQSAVPDLEGLRDATIAAVHGEPKRMLLCPLLGVAAAVGRLLLTAPTDDPAPYVALAAPFSTNEDPMVRTEALKLWATLAAAAPIVARGAVSTLAVDADVTARYAQCMAERCNLTLQGIAAAVTSAATANGPASVADVESEAALRLAVDLCRAHTRAEHGGAVESGGQGNTAARQLLLPAITALLAKGRPALGTLSSDVDRHVGPLVVACYMDAHDPDAVTAAVRALLALGTVPADVLPDDGVCDAPEAAWLLEAGSWARTPQGVSVVEWLLDDAAASLAAAGGVDTLSTDGGCHPLTRAHAVVAAVEADARASRYVSGVDPSCPEHAPQWWALCDGFMAVLGQPVADTVAMLKEALEGMAACLRAGGVPPGAVLDTFRAAWAVVLRCVWAVAPEVAEPGMDQQVHEAALCKAVPAGSPLSGAALCDEAGAAVAKAGETYLLSSDPSAGLDFVTVTDTAVRTVVAVIARLGDVGEGADQGAALPIQQNAFTLVSCLANVTPVTPAACAVAVEALFRSLFADPRFVPATETMSGVDRRAHFARRCSAVFNAALTFDLEVAGEPLCDFICSVAAADAAFPMAEPAEHSVYRALDPELALFKRLLAVVQEPMAFNTARGTSVVAPLVRAVVAACRTFPDLAEVRHAVAEELPAVVRLLQGGAADIDTRDALVPLWRIDALRPALVPAPAEVDERLSFSTECLGRMAACPGALAAGDLRTAAFRRCVDVGVAACAAPSAAATARWAAAVSFVAAVVGAFKAGAFPGVTTASQPLASAMSALMQGVFGCDGDDDAVFVAALGAAPLRVLEPVLGTCPVLGQSIRSSQAVETASPSPVRTGFGSPVSQGPGAAESPQCFFAAAATPAAVLSVDDALSVTTQRRRTLLLGTLRNAAAAADVHRVIPAVLETAEGSEPEVLEAAAAALAALPPPPPSVAPAATVTTGAGGGVGNDSMVGRATPENTDTADPEAEAASVAWHAARETAAAAVETAMASVSSGHAGAVAGLELLRRLLPDGDGRVVKAAASLSAELIAVEDASPLDLVKWLLAVPPGSRSRTLRCAVELCAKCRGLECGKAALEHLYLTDADDTASVRVLCELLSWARPTPWASPKAHAAQATLVGQALEKTRGLRHAAGRVLAAVAPNLSWEDARARRCDVHTAMGGHGLHARLGQDYPLGKMSAEAAAAVSEAVGKVVAPPHLAMPYGDLPGQGSVYRAGCRAHPVPPAPGSDAEEGSDDGLEEDIAAAAAVSDALYGAVDGLVQAADGCTAAAVSGAALLALCDLVWQCPTVLRRTPSQGSTAWRVVTDMAASYVVSHAVPAVEQGFVYGSSMHLLSAVAVDQATSGSPLKEAPPGARDARDAPLQSSGSAVAFDTHTAASMFAVPQTSLTLQQASHTTATASALPSGLSTNITHGLWTRCGLPTAAFTDLGPAVLAFYDTATLGAALHVAAGLKSAPAANTQQREVTAAATSGGAAGNTDAAWASVVGLLETLRDADWASAAIAARATLSHATLVSRKAFAPPGHPGESLATCAATVAAAPVMAPLLMMRLRAALGEVTARPEATDVVAKVQREVSRCVARAAAAPWRTSLRYYGHYMLQCGITQASIGDAEAWVALREAVLFSDVSPAAAAAARGSGAPAHAAAQDPETGALLMLATEASFVMRGSVEGSGGNSAVGAGGGADGEETERLRATTLDLRGRLILTAPSAAHQAATGFTVARLTSHVMDPAAALFLVLNQLSFAPAALLLQAWALAQLPRDDTTRMTQAGLFADAAAARVTTPGQAWWVLVAVACTLLPTGPVRGSPVDPNNAAAAAKTTATCEALRTATLRALLAPVRGGDAGQCPLEPVAGALAAWCHGVGNSKPVKLAVQLCRIAAQKAHCPVLVGVAEGFTAQLPHAK